MKVGEEKKIHEITLKEGSLAMLVNGPEHSLPKRANINGIRYNITFRNIGKMEGFGNYYMYGRGAPYEVTKEEKLPASE